MACIGNTTLLCALLMVFFVQGVVGGGWIGASATFYGGSDAAGTMGTYVAGSICIALPLNLSICAVQPIEPFAQSIKSHRSGCPRFNFMFENLRELGSSILEGGYLIYSSFCL